MQVVITLVIAGIVIGFGYNKARKSIIDTNEKSCDECDCSSGHCNIKD